MRIVLFLGGVSLFYSLCAEAKAPSLVEPAEIAEKAGTLEATIEELGRRYPELRTNFVLMHDSQSRQIASYEFPRVISHTADGRFAMAFNGRAGTQGYDELEMWRFEDETDSFHFRRIHFRRDGTAAPGDVDEALCKGCHGHDLRPNWESYSQWPGAFPRTDHGHSGEKYRHFGYRTEDHAGFDQFYEKQAGRGRYAFLSQSELESQFVVGKGGPGYRRIAPSHFTQLIASHNYRRVARLMRATPDFAKYCYALFAAWFDCDDFDRFLPKDYSPVQSYDWYLKDTLSEFTNDVNHYHFEHDEAQFAKLRYALEGRGISMEKWSMNFRGTPYAFVTPGGDPAGYLTSLLIGKDRSLEPFRVWNIVGDADYVTTTAYFETWTGGSKKQVRRQCDALAEAARAAF